MEKKFIFLDIDGPVIPGYMYIYELNPSRLRVFSPVVINILNELCFKTHAKIVTNSYHNYGLAGEHSANNLRVDLISQGLKEENLHTDWRTMFGSLEATEMTRQEGINEWIVRNDEYKSKWVCFDDIKFSEDPRLIHVDFNKGILFEEYQKALELFGIRQTLIMA